MYFLNDSFFRAVWAVWLSSEAWSLRPRVWIDKPSCHSDSVSFLLRLYTTSQTFIQFLLSCVPKVRPAGERDSQLRASGKSPRATCSLCILLLSTYHKGYFNQLHSQWKGKKLYLQKPLCCCLRSVNKRHATVLDRFPADAHRLTFFVPSVNAHSWDLYAFLWKSSTGGSINYFNTALLSGI